MFPKLNPKAFEDQKHELECRKSDLKKVRDEIKRIRKRKTVRLQNFDRDFLQKFLVTHPGNSTTHSSPTFNTKESLIRSKKKELLFRFDNKPGLFLIKLT